MPARVHALYRAGDLVALTRTYFDPIQSADLLDSFGGPRPIAAFIQILKRTETQALIVPGYTIMCASNRLAQRVHAHSFVEAVEGHPRIAPKLRRQHGQMRRFASPCGTEHDRMAEIANMQIQPEGCRARSYAMHEGWRARWIER